MEQEEITLDNWKPSAKTKTIPKSEWRERRNDNHYDVLPGLDDLRKINRYLKAKYPDYQIMEAFGMSCDTLMAIKHGFYSPIEGVYREFREFILRAKKKKVQLNETEE